MDIYEIKTTDIGYLERLLFNDLGEFNILSYEQLKEIPQTDISQLCVKYGMYLFPTKELIDFIKEEIAGQEDDTIEIGAGNGFLGKALGVRCTDSYQQDGAKMKLLYDFMKQPTVQYGAHVRPYAALDAVTIYNPKIVVGAWCTHMYNSKEHWREGNMFGIDEGKMLRRIKKYLFVGNSKVHSKKPILELPHKEFKADWLLSRSLNRELNVIWIWE